MWKKRLIDAGILIVVFIAAVVLFSYITNRGNDNMTADIGNAELPSVSFSYGNHEFNSLSGYVGEMDAGTMRDSITPVDGGRLAMNIQAYGNKIDALHYALYTLDGKDKLAENIIKNLEDKAELTFDETLLTEERLLVLTLNIGEKEVYYYTRVVVPRDFYMAECLDYMTYIHQNTLTKADSAAIMKAMEPNAEGDNSSFSHVTIHSSYDQVMWGKLSPSVVGAERLKIVEANPTFISAVLEFEVRCVGEENEEDIYRVKEYFRVRMSAGNLYLLDYDRTADQVFDASKNVLNEKGIVLGVGSYDVPFMVNKDGTIVSFVRAGELWNYNRNTDEMSLVFSFMDAENKDVRSLVRNHRIKPIAVDKNGNTTFAVYGYMNRGLHEGEVGAAIYYYSIEKNCITEEAFIPSDKSAAIAEMELGNLVYLSFTENKLYVLVDGDLYEINMKKGKKTALVKGLEEGQYVVSDDGRLIAYQSNGKWNEATEVVVKDLSTGDEYTAAAGGDECIRPLGFVNNDLVSGTAKKADTGQTVSGETVIPMYKLEIREKGGEVVENVQVDGVYILGAEIEDGMVTINRAVKDGNMYNGISADYISSNEEKKESNISLESYVTELKETQMRLVFGDGIQDKEAKVLKPKQVLMEKPEMITFGSKSLEGSFYVYGLGEMQGIYEKAGSAVQKADALKGTALTSSQKYIFERGNRPEEYSISGKEDVLAMQREQLAGGKAPLEVADGMSDGGALDFSGCTTEEMLYMISRGTPVIGMIDGTRSVILTGYDRAQVIFIDTSSGTPGAVSYEEMDQMLAGTGRTFIGYLP